MAGPKARVQATIRSESKEELSGLVFGKDVTVKIHGTDRYKRTFGRVFCGGMDVNELMVGLGFAWRDAQYSKDLKLNRGGTVGAREHRRGLWADSAPVAPWKWRRRS